MRRALVLLLLLNLAPLPSAQAQTDGPATFELIDPKGDVHPNVLFSGVPVSAGVSTPATDEVDITRFSVVDEGESLRIEMVVVQIRTPVPRTFVHASDTVEIVFGAAGHPNLYRIYSFPTTSLGPDDLAGEMVGRFCMVNGGCANDAVMIQIDMAKNAYRIDVPKAHLLGQNADGSPFPFGKATIPTLLVGTELGPWTVHLRRSAGFIVGGVADTVEGNAGPNGPFRLTSPVPNQGLVLRRVAAVANYESFLMSYDNPPYRDPAASKGMGVLIGQTTSLTFVLENRAAAKRLVSLEAMLDGPDGPPPNWKLVAPPTIEVPSGESRNATVTVTTEPGVKHREVVALRMTARALATTDTGFLRLPLVATLPVDLDHARLHLHAGSVPPTANRPCLPYDPCSRGYFWMNTAPEDPLANKDDGASTGTATATVPGIANRLAEFNFMMDTPVATPLTFDRAKPVTGKIVVSSRADVQVRLDVALSVTTATTCTYGCGDELLIGMQSKDAVVGASPATFEFSLPVDPNAAFVEPGSRYLRLRVTLQTSDPRAHASIAPGSVMVYPKQSSLELPLIKGDEDTGPLSHLRFYVEGDREEFLNPGRSKLFRVRLANEGPAPDRIIVNSTVAPESWTLQVQPAQRFELQPGESVSLGVLLGAPESVAEGARANVTLTAASERFTAAPGRLILRGVATRGVEIADDAGTYEVDDDTQRRVVVDAGGKSPHVSLAIMAAALVGVAWRRRTGLS